MRTLARERVEERRREVADAVGHAGEKETDMGGLAEAAVVVLGGVGLALIDIGSEIELRLDGIERHLHTLATTKAKGGP